MIGIREVEAAANRLDGVAVRTPLLKNHALDEAAGGRVLVKPECLQVTDSFKIRGAYNFLSQLTPEQAAKGVVAFSSGNHAQGVAAAGSMLNIHTAIGDRVVIAAHRIHDLAAGKHPARTTGQDIQYLKFGVG